MIEITLKKERNRYAIKVIFFFIQLLFFILIPVWMFFLPQINFAEILNNIYTNPYMCYVEYSFFVIITMCIYSFISSNLNKCYKLIISQKKINKYKKIRKGRV